MFARAANSIRQRGWVKGVTQLLKERDRGTVAVTFILALPVLMWTISILVQYAMITQARITLDRAVANGARAAMTSLPTDVLLDPVDGKKNVSRAILLVLETLSPKSAELDGEAEVVGASLMAAGYPLPEGFVERYSYAETGTDIAIESLSNGENYARQAVPRVRITVRYEFQLTAPWASLVIGKQETVGGISGRYLTLVSSLDVQLSSGREAASDNGGNPQ